ncbi:MAG: Enoyl-[acyl-carrier protein] reductase, partial [Subtercola sp.]|nr:Enoyl-[acyl-carrier protein] reductase [Subtercola sp.]
MGWVARPDLVAAVSEAGGMGLVPGSLAVEQVRADIARTRELTDRPIGVNIPIAFAKDPAVIDVVVDAGIRFVTTSAGSPEKYTPLLKEAGLIVFHVVPTLYAARKAVDAGVDGLVVEGVEGAGFKSPHEVASMVLLPLITRQLGVPVVAAGGIVDGASMLAAFALGAEGVQMGTRMLASVESGVHANVKDAVLRATETDTVLLNRHNRRPMRVLRTDLVSEVERDLSDPTALLLKVRDTYEGGDLGASLQQLGQGAGRIDQILPVAEILRRTVAEFDELLQQLSEHFLDR